MKKLLFILFAFPLLFASCSDDDNDGITLKVRDVTLTAGESHQIIAESESRPLSFKSSDTFIATVSEKGKVKAERIGEVDIEVSNGAVTEKVRISVKGEHALYPEPYLLFNTSKADVIAKMGKPSFEDEKTIRYDDFSNPAETATYTFGDKGLTTVLILIKANPYLSDFLAERYMFLKDGLYINRPTLAESTMDVNISAVGNGEFVSIKYGAIVAENK